MPTLTNAQLQAYLQANPDFKGTVNGQRVTAQPKQKSLIQNLIGGIVNPFINIGNKTLEAADAGVEGKLGDFLLKKNNYQTKFLDQDKYNNENLALGTAKDIAGVASLLIPGGALGKGIGGLIKTGAATGALGSFANQEGNNIDLGNIAQGAATGGAFGGALGLIGKGASAASSKLNQSGGLSSVLKKGSQGLNEFADGRDLNIFKRAVGGPAPSFGAKELGGAVLEKESMNLANRFGKQINNADDLMSFSDELFNEYGGAIKNAASQASQAGKLIDVNDIIKPLQAKLDKGDLLPEMRKPLEDVITSIQTTAPNGIVDPSMAYSLKQQVGDLGKFSTNADDAAKSTVWKEVYGSLNDKLRTTLKETGFEQYDDVNRILETSIMQRKWADSAIKKARPTATLNDMAQDTGLMAVVGTGNSLMAIPGMVAGKVMQSPITEKALGSGARGLAGFLDSVNVPQGMANQADDLAQVAAQRADEEALNAARSQLSQTMSKPVSLTKQGSSDIMTNIETNKKAMKTKTNNEIEELTSVNPTGTVFTEYTPQARANAPLGKNITTYDKTSGLNPLEEVIVYRGAPKNQKQINAGDFITTNKQLAKDYAGTGKVIELKVKAQDILDNLDEPLGEEYIYRPFKPKSRFDPKPTNDTAREQFANNTQKAATQAQDAIPTGVISSDAQNIFSRIPEMPRDQIQRTRPAQPSNIQQLIGGAATGVQNTAKNITDLIDKSGITRNNNAAKIGGLVTGMANQVPVNAESVDLQTFLSGASGVQSKQSAPSQGLDPEVAAAYKQLVLPVKQGGMGMSGSDAEKYLQNVYGVNLGGGATKTTESQKKFIAAGQQAQSALNILESGNVSTGKIGNIGNKVSQFLGTQNAVQTDYNSKLAAARGSAISALAGANVPPSEYERIADMIPVMTDEPKIAKQKLKSFAEAMNVYATAGT